MSASHPRLASGRYIVHRCIGTGGMGAVFLAFDDVLKGERAIKVLKPSLTVRTEVRARFRTEAIAMSKLNHPGIVRVFDQGQEGLTSFIVMEYLKAGSLHALMNRQGPLARDVALSACIDVAEALEHAHQNGVIHRDIKPDNLLIGPTGTKLTDFGLARLATAEGGLTRTRATFGTPSFMPPEQRLESKKTTARSDIYALCATLFILLTGRDPIDLYEPDAREELLDGVDERIADIIRCGCAADPAQRFPSAADLAAALEAARELPGSPRTRPDASPSPTQASPQDLDALQRLWRSYTTPEEQLGGAHTGHGGAETYASAWAETGGGASSATTPPSFPAETVGPVAPQSEAPPSPAPAPAAPKVPSAPPGSGRRWLGLGLLLALGLAAVAVVQPWNATDPAPTSNPVALAHPAETALLEADLSTAARALAELPPELEGNPQLLALVGVLHVSSDRGHAGRAAFRRAAAHATASEPRGQAIRLTDASGLDLSGEAAGPATPGVEARLADWTTVRGATADPFVDLLFLASMHPYLSGERLADELADARAAHADLAIFALLRFQLQRDRLDFEQQQSLLEEIHTAFPTVTAIQVERARLLMRQGSLDAAREALQQAARLQPDAAAPYLLLADQSARSGDEASRMEYLHLSLSDTVPEVEQRQFLLEHGETVAGLGRPAEATKLWAADLGMAADQTVGHHRETSVRGSRAAVLLRADPDEAAARTDAARALLQSETVPTVQDAAWEAELAYDDGVRAARAGSFDVSETQLASLEAADVAGTAAPRVRELAALLAMEMALSSPTADASSLEAAVQIHRPALSGRCSAHWIDARVASARDDLDALTEAAKAIRTGACRGRDLERGIYVAEVHQLLATDAAEAGDSARSKEAIEAFHTLWPDPEEGLPIVEAMALLKGPED